MNLDVIGQKQRIVKRLAVARSRTQDQMTIITKVGVSNDDHMNDDASEVDSFSRECYQALFSPHF